MVQTHVNFEVRKRILITEKPSLYRMDCW